MNNRDYDTWKLDYPDHWDDESVYCEYCEDNVEIEENLTEINYKDADRSTQTLWLCQNCVDEEIWK